MAAERTSLLHPGSFERSVLVAVIAGAGIGWLQTALAQVVGIPAFPDGTTGALLGLPALVVLGTVLSGLDGDRADRLLLGAATLLAVPLPFLWHASPLWRLALAGAIAGPLMVQSRICERGERGQVGTARPGRLSLVLSGLAAAALIPVGVAVAQILAWRLQDFAAPWAIVGPLSGAVIALFAAIGALPGHLGLAPDPAASRLEALLGRADGDLRRIVLRALELYRRCSTGLSALPREPAREVLSRTVAQIAEEIAELGERFLGLEPIWAQVGGEDSEAEIARLEKLLARTADPVARAQLGLAIKSYRGERDEALALSRRRERLVARMEAEVALLGSANLALVQARTGEAQNGKVELGSLVSQLETMLRREADVAALGDARAEAETGPGPETVAGPSGEQGAVPMPPIAGC